MRLSIAKFLVLSLVLLGATSASAITLTIAATTPTTIPVGGNVTFTVRLNTNGTAGTTSIFTSVSNSNAGAVGFVSGVSPPSIMLDTSTSVQLSRVTQPVSGVLGDPAGQIRAANYATPDASGGIAVANQLLATVTLVGLAPGTANFANLFVVGSDSYTVNQIEVGNTLVLTGGFTVTVIPEPGTALLMGLGLMGLATAGRRSA